ncbi:NAD(P)/FAD-dependent oxidoreductase [Rhodococcoides fascians]|uniref:NAD(P)/FAD-dependent oxidoreductase n=1 Tax=Rhodococcoides fascians TaxID=1828 RepID=UPI00050CB252|nr:FAD-dependent oxidoreductase [Rhodococcus fascians]
MTLHRIVVVGGSIAAATAVATLRMEGFDGSIIVLSDENVRPYSRVPLSKQALKGTALDVGIGTFDEGVDLRLCTRAVGLDPARRFVATDRGTVSYDGLVIATGARARRIGDAGQREFVLRTRDDCARLRSALRAARSVAVVGGGFLGMEVASTCVELGLETTVISEAPALERLLGPVLAQHVRSTAAQAGVDFVVSHGGARLIGLPEPSAVELGDGRLLSADVIVCAVGDVPNVEWLADSGIELEGGVVVDDRGRVGATNGRIVAAGDVAVLRGRRYRIPTWTNAVEQSRGAARALLRGDDAPVYVPSAYAWTEQFGLEIKMVGPLPPLGEPDVLDGSLGGGSALLAWPNAMRPAQVAAVCHPTAPVKLKRLVFRPSMETEDSVML